MSETILNRPTGEQFKDDYTRYALYTTYKRVLSDFRDGLKPVQRRILYAMFNDTKAIGHTVKSAAVVGDVMKLYHGHGDCLAGNTMISTSDGYDISIKEIFDRKIESVAIKAVDCNTGKLCDAVATNFRIGQIATKNYCIILSDGSRVNCTSNHPFLTEDRKWIKAEDLCIGQKLFTKWNKKHNYRRAVVMEVIDKVITDIDPTPYYDFTVEGYENMMIPILGERMICVHNSGIYGTFRPMINWWESKVPLIDKQGNFGNLSGDVESAQRYTEVKLSKFAMDCVISELADTKKAVDWLDNYSNTTKEPEFLPVKVPLLLIEGSLGIGVGLKAEIPAHNLAEVIDATIYLMHNPEGQVALIPDHCMNCEIYDTDWEKISKVGFGHYKIRGIIDIEDYDKNRKALVIKSLPDLTFLNVVKDKIEELVEKKKIIQIDNILDQCEQNSMRLVIVLKSGADPYFVRDMIYKNTKVEQTLRINLETLYGFNPLRMSYKSYLLSFIDFRKTTKFRVYTNILQDIQTRIHERDAYIKVLESGEIDNIIKMIRKQKNIDDQALIDYLVKKLKITDLQAKYIIGADLRKLSIGYLNKYKQEAIDLEAKRQYYLSLILDEKKIEAEIEAELLEIKAKYGKPRTCKIIKGIDDNDIPKGTMQIIVTEKNFVRKVPIGSSIGSFRNDAVRTAIRIDNTDSIIIFDERGRVFKLPVHKIPFTDKSSNGTDIRFLIKGLTANINSIIPESVIKELSKKGSHDNKHYLITITRNGLYKRMDLDDFITVPPSGILYAKIDDGDYIKDVIIAHSSFNLIVYSDRKAVCVNVNDIPYLKRNTKGSRAIYNADTVDGLCVIDQTKSDIIVVTDSGRINRIPIISLPIAANKKGFNVIKLGTNDKINSVMSGNDSNIICVKTLKNYHEIPVAQLQVGSSISTGEKLIPMKADQMLRCWIK